MKERKTKDKVSIISNKKIFIVLTILAIFIGFKLYNHFFKNLEKYTIVKGYVEKNSVAMAYIFKDELKVDTDSKTSATPVIEQFKRVAKGDNIAVYNNSNYDKYSEQISKMDTEIQSLIKDLPEVYSSDISNIDNEISKISNEAMKINSYVKMQEYKTKLDELSYKKVITLGELSPAGSKIRELIEDRKSLEEKRKDESDNVKAPISGIVSYNLDGLENLSNTNDVLNYDSSKIEDIIKTYQNNNSNTFGIKIIDNFNAYIIIKQQVDDNDNYIKEGKNFTIKLTDSNFKIDVTLSKVIQTNNTKYLIFNVNNGIEKLKDNRCLSCEIIWYRVEGLAIPKKYIKTSEDGKYKYVTIIKNSEYINVPIDIITDSDSICIINNLSDNEKNSLGIQNNNSIEIYNQILA